LKGSGSIQPVSNGGGISPRWRRDGKQQELFYLSADGLTIMHVPVTRGRLSRSARPCASSRLARL
jgi:hypothetical protein